MDSSKLYALTDKARASIGGGQNWRGEWDSDSKFGAGSGIRTHEGLHHRVSQAYLDTP